MNRAVVICQLILAAACAAGCLPTYNFVAPVQIDKATTTADMAGCWTFDGHNDTTLYKVDHRMHVVATPWDHRSLLCKLYIDGQPWYKKDDPTTSPVFKAWGFQFDQGTYLAVALPAMVPVTKAHLKEYEKILDEQSTKTLLAYANKQHIYPAVWLFQVHRKDNLCALLSLGTLISTGDKVAYNQSPEGFQTTTQPKPMVTPEQLIQWLKANRNKTGKHPLGHTVKMQRISPEEFEKQIKALQKDNN